MPYHSGQHMVDPIEIFGRAHMQAGMHIADFGCGRTGHIVFPATRIIGERGVVYAIDIMKDVLENINKRAQSSGMTNVHTVWSDVERIGKTAIPPKTLDVVFIVNTLVQSDNRHAMLQEAHRLLKDKARLVIVDWEKKGLSFSPDDERFVDFANMKQWAQMHGFVVQEEFGVGKFHHGMVLFKHD